MTLLHRVYDVTSVDFFSPTMSSEVSEFSLGGGTTLASLVDNRHFSDVTLVCGPEIEHKPRQPLHARRCVLASVSSGLSAMFRSDCKEATTGALELPEVNRETVLCLLELIYTLWFYSWTLHDSLWYTLW